MKKLIVSAVAVCMFLSSAVVAEPLAKKYRKGYYENLEAHRIDGTLGFWNTINYADNFDLKLMIAHGEESTTKAKTSLAEVERRAFWNEVLIIAVVSSLLLSILISSSQ